MKTVANIPINNLLMCFCMDQETQDLDTEFLQAIETLSKLEDIVARGTLVSHYPHQQENRLVFIH